MKTLSRWLLLGEWRAHPVRALLAVAAIAVGVAMGFAIHLINASAFNEFSAAVKSLSGQADIQVSAREGGFDEAIYPRLAQNPSVAVASPVLTLNAGVPGAQGSLKIIGLDAFRAGFVSPGLLGATDGDNMVDMMADDAVFLSPAAMSWLKTQRGGTVQLRSGTRDFTLRVAGGLQEARPGQRIGVMDIGAAQWRFDKVGTLSRIDLRLRDGIDRAGFQRDLARELEREFPGRFNVGQPNDDDAESRNQGMSRAYRVNLTVLALVALFTGAFLVFSTQALSVIRRRSQFALLRVLGVERGQLLRQVLLEGASLGVVGALAGIGAGYALAATALHFFGGDLGAGYFTGARPAVQFTPVAAVVFFALGLGVALLGCLTPAWEASRAAPAVALKSGTDEVALARLARVWPSVLCIVLAGALAFAPPVFELPLFGYAAIALLLIGGIGLMPRLAASLFGLVNRVAMRRNVRHPVLALTMARLANASGQAAIALGGVLSSFSLMVAMAIMVSSFRVSLDDWLVQLLPADLYVRIASGGSAGGLGPPEQRALTALPGAARIDFLRSRQISLDPARPDVLLMARTIDAADPSRTILIRGETVPVPNGAVPVWVSEAVVDLYGVKAGGTLRMPLAGRLRDFFVAGVWRDYATQAGSVQMRLSDYRALTGDQEVNDAAMWVAKGVTADRLEQQIRALPFGRTLDFAKPGDIRALSMTIFDRSFAVTYVLEAIAIAIGLAGVAATFSAQTLARAKEFGMLRHVGVTRGQVLRILALEGGALTALGVACGFVLGFIISVILVYVVNPQSFHWSMQLHVPWTLVGAVAAVLLVASVVTALVSGRFALSGGPIRAVREDW
ncbi:multidrug ABC transporter substrate-binding protein [Massilia violaceinigra]|uniref:Multidrug ABC transporter substrate-binding protein n=1 Tax=Massilia violaceinigra TaxID=2045208 RepID=A0A2D2DQX9_9BURK|nr:FtsX-like permease family protein [Massilia violaceinigra]ATQ77380.1 multidrug ABC transporter substrate-binding protein [Massilia violaceinigra]